MRSKVNWNKNDTHTHKNAHSGEQIRSACVCVVRCGKERDTDYAYIEWTPNKRQPNERAKAHAENTIAMTLQRTSFAQWKWISEQQQQQTTKIQTEKKRNNNNNKMFIIAFIYDQRRN